MLGYSPPKVARVFFLHTRDSAGPQAMVKEACSQKSAFCLDSSFVFLSGLRLAFSNFGNFVRISDLAYFLAEICLIWQDLTNNRRRGRK